MTLNEIITQLVDGILNKDERRILEDLVDNYIGTNEEGYIANKDYYEQHKQSIKPIWRKLKESNKFGTFVSLIRPNISKGIISLFEES